MSLEQDKELLSNAIKQLVSDVRFLQFMEAIEGLKQEAVANAVSDKTLETLGTSAAALGEVRAYMDIQNLVKEYTPPADKI